MKRFIYFESTEGGMKTHDSISGPDYFSEHPHILYGWMNERCKKEDKAMLRWMKDAEVGDVYWHRLGVMVRATT